MSNFLEQMRELDPNDPGRWPLAFRLGAIGAIFIANRAYQLAFVALNLLVQIWFIASAFNTLR